MKGLEEIKKEENVRVVMLSIFPRPSQSAVYEEARVEANQGIKEGIQRLKEEGQKVEFLELDETLREDLFEWRGIHLRWDGMRILGLKMSEKLEGAEKIEEGEYGSQVRASRKGGIFGEIKRAAEDGKGVQNRDQLQEGRKEELERMRGDVDGRYSNFVNRMDRGRGNGGYNSRGRGGVGERGAMGRGQGNRGRGGPGMGNRGGRGEERGRGWYATRGVATYGGPVSDGGNRGRGSRN